VTEDSYASNQCTRLTRCSHNGCPFLPQRCMPCMQRYNAYWAHNRPLLPAVTDVRMNPTLQGMPACRGNSAEPPHLPKEVPDWCRCCHSSMHQVGVLQTAHTHRQTYSLVGEGWVQFWGIWVAWQGTSHRCSW
jgi:hypothetical protein